MFYIGKARKINDAEMTSIAHKYGIDEASLRAIKQVEAGNAAFYSSGALRCLYEPHIAYRMTRGAVRTKLVNAGLAYQKWGAKPYPRSSFSRIDKCSEIAGEEVAALSTSWGSPQMMGFNHGACGYATAVQMVKAFADSERAQIEAMVKFIKSNDAMYNALKAKDWAGFAKRYNGPGYAKNKYDVKIGNAYKSWEKKLANMPKPAPEPEPVEPPKKKTNTGSAGLAAVIVASAAAFFTWLTELPCNWFGFFCGG